jgi:hypothetical protein
MLSTDILGRQIETRSGTTVFNEGGQNIVILYIDSVLTDVYIIGQYSVTNVAEAETVLLSDNKITLRE